LHIGDNVLMLSRIAFRCDHELREQVEQAARARRLDMSDWCRMVLTEAARRDLATPPRSNGARPRPGGALPEQTAKLSGRDVQAVTRLVRRGV
jgi:hypothetical protein